ncbi:pseudouridine-5'-phosphate glycosidase [Aestuariivirga sp. YIM B02566]|uniref:Pseudouridine-5'-phosphate glycosidase n=1 Tax=Taklimakanibacter albus TaxID=2800327 RepID=A0ACC5R9H1_9HYPH|nr:pseudouridine-5'-phosphate glycosidase [Aestuariivirga sp. YIM B02566]MBK1869272.1 pseudouridine-5'-phosphate glycosidase [Aestuariivirga sp. YIM B02566]
MNQFLNIAPQVAEAIQEKRPVVALESTIIAHGMAFPQNAETAFAVEKIIRDEGAVPATIAVRAGKLKVGLSETEIETLARNGPSIAKLSTRDLPHAVALERDGATTVASTMRIAALAGIHVFATGGIGGVHRGAAETFDISADLGEMALSNVAVVTAGAKAILDLALTIEKLETLGVPVVGYGTDDFPAFYSRHSGLKCPMRVDRPEDMARLMKAKWGLGLAGGVVVANPIPAEFEIPAAEITPLVEKAVAEARDQKIEGRAVTPFLLSRLARATAGRSLAANIELVKNNAAVAARIAKAYWELP